MVSTMLPLSTQDIGFACAAAAVLLSVKAAVEVVAAWPRLRRPRTPADTGSH
jgi:hypothetical protein